ncbi:MAG: extracellular solute-binding protein [Planctomycetota bacterium]|jgi:iron(III) transport system substrate-binding protein
MRNVLVAICALAAGVAGQEAAKVTVYVSLDREHSSPVLARFEQETGIEVDAQYDTEANKTIGLVRRLITEKSEPQADVYWNNELATTIKLKESGVLQRYSVPAAESIPAPFKDPDGYWVGFAARGRVLIVNTDLVKPDEMPTSMWDLTEPRWSGKVCMARPQTGTTAAHAAALYVLDRKRADEYFDRLLPHVVWLTGNAHCMREVSAGRFAFGWTDTDDFNVARLQGRPVARVFPDAGPDDVGVMYIPNSLVLIKGCPHPEAGKRLIDWLLRPEIEAQLAAGRTAQIPVRPEVKVPDHVRRPDQVGKTMVVDWERVGREYDQWVEHVRAKLAAAEKTSGTLLWIVAVVVVVAVAGVIVLKRATGEPT